MMRKGWLLLALSVVGWFVALGAWIIDDPQLPATAYEPFSSYNTSPGGTSQSFAYLAARQHARVTRLEREIVLANPPHNATIFRIGLKRDEEVSFFPKSEDEDEKKDAKKSKSRKQREKAKTKETFSLLDDADEGFVRHGGRIVVAPAGNLLSLRVEPGKCTAYTQVFPTQPAVPKIDVARDCHVLGGEALQRFHSIVDDESGPVIARWHLGAGDVFLVAIPELFSNEYIGRGGNLAVVEMLAGDKRPLFFDETIHGILAESSIFDLLIDRWHLGPALALLVVAALAAFWRRARATGKPERGDRDVRSDAVDLVRSVGSLYDRAVDREESLRLYYQAFVRVVHARTGLKGEPLDRYVRDRTRGYDPKPHYHDISRDEFQRQLNILNHAYETVGYAESR